jgi:hypothetical protein
MLHSRKTATFFALIYIIDIDEGLLSHQTYLIYKWGGLLGFVISLDDPAFGLGRLTIASEFKPLWTSWIVSLRG